MVSATPVPVMMDLVDNDAWSIEGDRVNFFKLDARDDYIGIGDMVPLEVDGEPVYLALNELNYRSKIPFSNDKVIALYDGALLNSDNRQGVLILDCTCPRVYAAGNVIVKASKVQGLYQSKGIEVTVVTITGRGISVKYPNKKWDHKFKNKFLLQNVLESIDQKCGLEMPVIVFGFSKMRRGVSFRNSNRVPT
jgi:hypothetical protein